MCDSGMDAILTSVARLRQVIVQRALAGKNLVHAKAGTIFAAYLKILPMFIMVFPGMISRVLFKDDVACPDAESCEKSCGNRQGCSNLAYPRLVFNLLPTGMVGIMMAVMLAAVMSSLSSVYNSASTVFTVDIWQRIRPRASDREKLTVGRAIVAVLVVLGLIWMPLIERGGSGKLFRYIQTINFLMGSPIMAIYFVGMVWPRANEAGALGGFLIGLLLAGARFATEYIYESPACGEADTRPAFASINYMYFGIILFLVSVTVMIVLSLLTKPIPTEELDGLTWVTLKNKSGSVNKETNATKNSGTADVASDNKDVELNNFNESMQSNTLETDFSETNPVDVLHQTRKQNLVLNASSVILLMLLLFLWIWYR